MISLVAKIFISIVLFQEISLAQGTPTAVPPVPSPDNQSAPTPPPPTPTAVTEELTDSGMVMKKNNFSYDGNEGRDPFKVFREIPFAPDPNGKPNPGSTNPNPQPVMTEGILTAIVPGDVTIVGILNKKEDPIVLVKVRNVKGIFKLKMNSRIGRNEGRVIDIQKDKMTVEQVRDFDGQKFTEKVEMKIREKKR